MTSEQIKAFLARRQAEKAQDTPAAAPQAAINPPAPAAAAPTLTTLAAPTAAAPAAASQGPPPWFSKNCRRCVSEANPGFNTAKGTACSSCVVLSKVQTTGYHWAVQPSGKIAWAPKNEPLPAQATAVVDAGKKTAAPPPVVKVPPLSFEELCSLIEESSLSSLNKLTADLVTEDYKHLDPEEVETLLDFIEDAKGRVVASWTAQTPTEQEPVKATTAVVEAVAAPEQPPAAVVEAVTTSEQPPAADKAPRGRRPRKEAAQPAEAAPAQGTLPFSEPAARASGFVLMLGANVVRGSLSGFQVVYVEDILGSVEGYWQDEVFARRDKIWKAISSNPKVFTDALQGKIVVQQAKTPDNDNMVSALMSLGPTIIASTMV